MPINKNTFCVAPWYSIFVNADKKLAPCCKFKKHDYNYNDIKQYFNSKELNKVRQDLLDGIKNENCSKCWSDEDKGGDSLRLISNRTVATDPCPFARTYRARLRIPSAHGQASGLRACRAPCLRQLSRERSGVQ